MPTKTASNVAGSTRPRASWIDGAKGIGILLVVYAHAARAIYKPYNAPYLIYHADRVIYSFHMPFFFLASGLFVWRSIGKGRKGFIIGRLVSLVYPYFLWSIIAGALALIFSSKTNSPIGLTDILLIPIQPIEQFWFLYALAICNSLLFLCYPSRLLAGFVALIGCALVSVYGSGPMILRAFTFLPFVVAGILLSRPLTTSLSRYTTAYLILIIAGVSCLLRIVVATDGLIDFVLIALCGSMLTLFAGLVLDRTIAGNVLALLGKSSLAIFVTHTIFSAGLRIALHASSMQVPNLAVLIATFAAGIVGPLVMWLIAVRYGLTEIIGFGQSVRSRA